MTLGDGFIMGSGDVGLANLEHGRQLGKGGSARSRSAFSQPPSRLEARPVSTRVQVWPSCGGTLQTCSSGRPNRPRPLVDIHRPPIPAEENTSIQSASLNLAPSVPGSVRRAASAVRTWGVAVSTRGTPASLASTAAQARPAHSCMGGHPGGPEARTTTNSLASATPRTSSCAPPRYCRSGPGAGGSDDDTAWTVTAPASSIIRAATPTGLSMRADSPAVARSFAARADSDRGTR